MAVPSLPLFFSQHFGSASSCDVLLRNPLVGSFVDVKYCLPFCIQNPFSLTLNMLVLICEVTIYSRFLIMVLLYFLHLDIHPFSQFDMFSVNISLSKLYVYFSFSAPFWTLIMYILFSLMKPHISCRLFHSFLLFLWLGNFKEFAFEFTDFFSSALLSLLFKPITVYIILIIAFSVLKF